MAKYKRMGLKIVTENNGVRITEGFIPFRKKRFFPYNNISEVGVAGATKRLVLKMNDGKEHKFAIGMTKVGRLQKDIEENL